MIVNLLAGLNSGMVATLSGYILAFLNNSFVYGALYFILVFFFTYFYTTVTFDPKMISQNLQKAERSFPRIRPTSRHRTI